MRDENELIATCYLYRTAFATHEINPVTFHRLNSTYYHGVKWAVRRGSSCLNTDGEWEYEPLPSSRDDAFYARCRFDSLARALATAERFNGKDQRELRKEQV